MKDREPKRTFVFDLERPPREPIPKRTEEAMKKPCGYCGEVGGHTPDCQITKRLATKARTGGGGKKPPRKRGGTRPRGGAGVAPANAVPAPTATPVASEARALLVKHLEEELVSAHARVGVIEDLLGRARDGRTPS